MIFVGNRRVNQGKSADSAEIHQDDQNKLRKNTELRCDSKGKPDRSDSGRRFVKAGAKRQTFCRADNNATDKKQQEIHYGNGCGVFHCRTVNAPAADFGIVLFATDGECTQNQNGSFSKAQGVLTKQRTVSVIPLSATKRDTQNQRSCLMALTPSNLSPASEEYDALVKERAEKLREANPDMDETAIPVDLVTCSGSGLDPHISPAAEYQVARIAKANDMTEDEVREIIKK